ncbi:MAG: TonB-dependent receptor [Rhodothermia bacterium]|nr:TonB-dependent receptor [Rhodothermia bacterium]
MTILVPAAFSQTASVTGTVVDAVSNDPLSSVNVSIDGTSFGASTAVNGRYRIDNLPSGTYILRASMVGYQPAVEEIQLAAGRTLGVNFRLEESFVEIPEVLVEWTVLTGGFKGIESLPGSAHFVSPAELEKFAYNDVGRVLRKVPGVNIQEEDGYGLRPNIGLRGTGSERSSKITVMEDGVLIAPAPYAAPAAYYFPSIGRMHAVEVRKGSSQIRFGPYTTGGAINLISTRIPSHFSGRLDLLAGNDDNRIIHASVGDSFDHVGFLLETYQSKADGFKRLDGGGSTGFDKKDYLAKFRLNTDPEASVYQSLTLKAGFASELSDETYLGLTDADFAATPNRRYAASQQDLMDTEQKQLVARHVIKPSNKVDVTTTLYRTDFSRNWYKLDKVRAGAAAEAVSISNILQDPDQYRDALAILEGATSPNANALSVKANNRSYYALGVQSTLGLDFRTDRMLHEIELGLRVHRDEIDRFQWIDEFAMSNGTMLRTSEGVPGTESNRVEQADALAGFVQYRSEVGRVTLLPGIRYERVRAERKDYGKEDPSRVGTDLSTRSNTVDAIIPGVGIDYRITRDLHGFAGVHKGFAPPGSRDGTRPESSVNYESGLRLLSGLTFAEAVFFFNRYDNLLGSDLAAGGGQGTTDQFNGGRVDVWGVELSGTYDFGRYTARGYSIPLGFSYTYTSATFENSFESEFEPWGIVAAGDDLPYVPPHQLSMSLGLETTVFSFDLSGKYTGQMRTTAGSGAVIDGQATEAHFTLDAAASYRVSRNLSIFGAVLNLTDAEYIAARRPAGVRPGLPRHVRLGLKTRF